MKITINIEDGMSRKIRFFVENPDPYTAFLAACRVLNSLKKEESSGDAETSPEPKR